MVNLKAAEEADLGECVAVECVAVILLYVQDVLHEGVGLCPYGTGEACVHTVAIVHNLIAHLVAHDGAVGIAEEEGVDGRHLVGHSEDVADGVVAVRGAEVPGDIVAVSYVGAHLEPGLGLDVGGETRCETLETGVGRDTLVLQIVGREEERSLVVGLRYADAVLLTEALAVCVVLPVVGSEQVVLALVVDDVAEHSVGVELVAIDDETAAVGVVDVVAEVAEELFVDKLVKVFALIDVMPKPKLL